jgi:hypothetical protein
LLRIQYGFFRNHSSASSRIRDLSPTLRPRICRLILGICRLILGIPKVGREVRSLVGTLAGSQMGQEVRSLVGTLCEEKSLYFSSNFWIRSISEGVIRDGAKTNEILSNFSIRCLVMLDFLPFCLFATIDIQVSDSRSICSFLAPGIYNSG